MDLVDHLKQEIDYLLARNEDLRRKCARLEYRLNSLEPEFGICPVDWLPNKITTMDHELPIWTTFRVRNNSGILSIMTRWTIPDKEEFGMQYCLSDLVSITDLEGVMREISLMMTGELVRHLRKERNGNIEKLET